MSGILEVVGYIRRCEMLDKGTSNIEYTELFGP